MCFTVRCNRGRRGDSPQNRGRGKILGMHRCTREQCRFVRSEISGISVLRARAQLCFICRIGASSSRRRRRVGWSVSTADFGSLIIVHSKLNFYENSSKLTFLGFWMSPLQLSHSSDRVNLVVSSPLEVDRLGNPRYL